MESILTRILADWAALDAAPVLMCGVTLDEAWEKTQMAYDGDKPE